MPDARFVPPHDTRYGRLFSDGDVGNIIAAVLELVGRHLEGAGCPVGIDDIDLDELGAHLTFPVGEPMFLIRASQSCTRTMLEDHLKVCEENVLNVGGPTNEYVRDVREAIVRFRTFEEEGA